jgi:hypothetical protein
MGNIGSRISRNLIKPVQVPGLECILPERRAILWVLKYKYGGYKITDPIEVNRRLLAGTIKYIDRNEESQGLGEFMKTLEKDARTVKANEIRVEFDQCSKPMEQKLEKHAKSNGFECETVPWFGEDARAGDNIQISKTLKD